MKYIMLISSVLFFIAKEYQAACYGVQFAIFILLKEQQDER